MVWRVAVLLLVCGGVASQDFDHYINEFVAEIDGDDFVAELVAGSHDLELRSKADLLGPNMFHFASGSTQHRSKRSAESVLERLRQDNNVVHVEQMKLLERHKRAPLASETREIIYDKQTELERPEVDQTVILERYFGSSRKRGQKCTREENVKRGLMEFDDPLFCLQWYLGSDVFLQKRENNDGETKGHLGYDVRAAEVWKRNITGHGVVVTVLDDGLDHQHPDLRDNYNKDASYDLNDKDSSDHDPSPQGNKLRNAHGTRCAGEIAAAANNGVCGVGIAYNAQIGGIRMLDGDVTDRLEAEALRFNRDFIDIYSASWGPRDDGETMEGPSHFASLALREGAEKGRNGLGSIFSWATGNGGMKDDCSCDGYVGSIYTISIGCVNSDGLSTYFSEICPSTMAVIFTGGSHAPPGRNGYNHPDISIITTDINGQCDLDFEGTSSAAPLAAGVFALVLEANPLLTWRDMQHLLANTAHVPNGLEDGWTMNGGGFHVNHKFGFGVMDAEMMVLGALNWTTVPEQQVCNVSANNPAVQLPPGGSVTQTLETDGCGGQVNFLEHTQVHMTLTTRRRGDLSIKVTSPEGTVSEILSTRVNDDYSGEVVWTFLTVHNWGESPVGEWTLSVEDTGSAEKGTACLTSWSLTLYGTTTANPNEVERRKPGDYGKKDVGGDTHEGAYTVSQAEVQEIMESEQQASRERLENKVEMTRHKLAQLDDLAQKVLTGDDYALYRKYVLGEEGQKAVEAEQHSRYTNNWWKRRLQPLSDNRELGDNRENTWQADDTQIDNARENIAENHEYQRVVDNGGGDNLIKERWEKEMEEGSRRNQLGQRGNYRVSDKRGFKTEVDESVEKRTELEELVHQAEKALEAEERAVRGDQVLKQNTQPKDLTERENEKIDEILAIISAMLDEDADES